MLAVAPAASGAPPRPRLQQYSTTFVVAPLLPAATVMDLYTVQTCTSDRSST